MLKPRIWVYRLGPDEQVLSRQIAFLDEVAVDKGHLADSSRGQIDGHQIPDTTAYQEDNVTSCQAFLNFLRVGS